MAVMDVRKVVELSPECAPRIDVCMRRRWPAAATQNMTPHEWPKPFHTLPQQLQQQLDQLLTKMEEGAERYIGFPNSLDLHTNECLAKFLGFPINNIGDPFVMNAGLHTCEFEKEALEFCMDLLHLDNPRDRWGYITNGSTESNTYGLMLGRDIYPDSILFFSQDSHYCLPKIAHMLRMEAEIVPSDDGGEIDYDALRDALKTRCVETGRPPVLCCNVGTTMKGALDKPDRILAICDELGLEERHLHCDAALHGMMLPFLEGAPIADFRLPIGSLSFSGHKFPGSPIPCGVVLTRTSTICNTQQLLWRRENNAEYVGSIDTTISGSRNGISVLTLWLQLMRFGREGLRERVRHSMEMVQLAQTLMQEQDIPCYHHPFSNILVFPQPSHQLLRRWMLSAQGETLAHIVLMPGTGPEKVARFVEELKEDPGMRLSSKDFHVPKLETTPMPAIAKK